MRRPIVLVLLVLLLIAPFTVLAQNSEPPPPAPPEGAPAEVAPPPEAAPTPAPVHHRRRTRKRRRHRAKAPEVETTVEPANARLKVRSSGAPIYSRGSRQSEQIGTLSADKYVQVTGSTKSYLQIQLKDGRTGYIEPSSVELVTPYDKEFLLTADSPVFAAPNQFAQKMAEVHRGKYVHVIGHALSYMQIRMKDGTQGYVPMTAAQ
jgi:Bacterial SH3 domain